jgi:hypothetical protein
LHGSTADGGIVERLAEAARAAGEAFVELQLRGPHLPASDLDPLCEGSFGSATVDAFFTLHRELLHYTDATRRTDGVAIIKAIVMNNYGEGIARRTMMSLDEVVRIIVDHVRREGRPLR